MADDYNANVKIRKLPRKTDQIIETIAAMRGLHKWQVVREALIEYADAHQKEVLAKLAHEAH